MAINLQIVLREWICNKGSTSLNIFVFDKNISTNIVDCARILNLMKLQEELFTNLDKRRRGLNRPNEETNYWMSL